MSEDGSRHWPVTHGRPLLFPGMGAPKVNSDTHLSNPLPDSAMALIRETRGWVLHLSPGETAERYDNVVEAEAAIFRHTDLTADVHELPFVDCSFEAVIALNAFEHYRDTWQAAREIYRVLRPGGRILIHTSFLQPLHEAPGTSTEIVHATALKLGSRGSRQKNCTSGQFPRRILAVMACI